MKKFIEEFNQLRRNITSESQDLTSFWLRKSKKPVLSVLMVQKSVNDKPKLYRGTNMEVSMPTGSLCAERNVIGSALGNVIHVFMLHAGCSLLHQFSVCD